MPFGAHETMEVHEVLNEKLNLINHFAFYAREAQSGQLQQMIDRHMQAALYSYDRLIAYTHDYNAAQQRHQAYGMPGVSPQHIMYGLQTPPQLVPQMRMNDQTIAIGMLWCHKNSAQNCTRAALECADPNLRQMLISDSASCVNQAYEVFLFLNENGMYQVPTLRDHTAKTYLHAYQPAQNQEGMMDPPREMQHQMPRETTRQMQGQPEVPREATRKMPGQMETTKAEPQTGDGPNPYSGPSQQAGGGDITH